MRTFYEIKQEYNLSQKDFWTFLQIGHCIKTNQKNNSDPSNWEKDVGEQILKARWKKLVVFWHNCSYEAQSQLIQYKLLNRSHWAPNTLAKLKLKDSDTCWRCEKKVGTLVHMIYSCEKKNISYISVGRGYYSSK